MKFDGVKCDECQRIRQEVNHWVQLYVWESKNAGVLAIALGRLADLLMLTRTAPPVEPVVHDLCGQDCLSKHVAKLLVEPPRAEEPKS
jgi:hypothetical protein